MTRRNRRYAFHTAGYFTAARRHLGMNSAELAARIGATEADVTAWETGTVVAEVPA
jgi:DNA-binding transcriptional regulator YiaG